MAFAQRLILYARRGTLMSNDSASLGQLVPRRIGGWSIKPSQPVAAGDEAAVRQHHARQGVVCESVRRVHSPHRSSNALTDEEKAIVRHMIVADHATPAGSQERLRHAG